MEPQKRVHGTHVSQGLRRRRRPSFNPRTNYHIMIDFNKVSFSHSEHPQTEERILAADIKWHREVSIHNVELLAIEHKDGPKAIINQAKNMLLNKLWDDIYGALNEPLHRLYDVALRG